MVGFMDIVVTGATGQLGRLVIDELLKRVPAERLVALARDPAKTPPLTRLGLRVRMADYDQPHTLRGAFSAGDRVLLISSDQAGEVRTTQHAAVIAQARAAGVALLAYTSVLGADTATFEIGRDHRATELLLMDSGLPYVLLRNGWYNENYTGYLAATLTHGRVFASAGAGRVATAACLDYAAAAAEVLTGEGHENRAYELSGDRAWSLAEYAAEVTGQSGREVGYTSMPEAEFRRFMIEASVPAEDADALVDADAAIARGELAATPGDLRTLIGRPTTPITDSIRSTLKQIPQFSS